MTRLVAHFDGKVIVPDEPVDLPRNQKLIVHVEPESVGRPRGTSGREFLEAVKKVKISHEDLAEMNKAIEEGCEQVDDDGW
jgi:hypothetical protein